MHGETQVRHKFLGITMHVVADIFELEIQLIPKVETQVFETALHGNESEPV